MVVQRLKQIGKVKNLNQWVLYELTENFKKSFWSVIFSYSFYAMRTNHFSIRLWRAMKRGFYMTTGDNQLSSWTEKKLQSTSQSQTCTKKKKGHGHSSVIWTTIAFWIPEKPLHLKSMLSKSMRCTKNCNVCSTHWSIKRAQFLSMTTPDHTSHNQRFTSWMNWATKFCLIHHIHLTCH